MKPKMKTMSTHPSIFNDVLGPVMRGPSSSHTAASWRIARVAMDLLKDELVEALIEFDADGAWAPNYEEQGTVLGMSGGLLGIDITDKRIIDHARIAKERKIRIRYAISRFPTDHANTVRLTLTGRSEKQLNMTAVSLGGGMFEVRLLNGFPLKMQGDYHELLGYTVANTNGQPHTELENMLPEGCMVNWSENGRGSLFQLKSLHCLFQEELIAQLEKPWIG
jgi:L-serine dehydratase